MKSIYVAVVVGCNLFAGSIAFGADYQQHPDVRCMAIGLSLPIAEATLKQSLEIELNSGVQLDSIRTSYRTHKDRAIDSIPDEYNVAAIELVDTLAKGEARRADDAYQNVLNKSHYIEKEYARCLVIEHYKNRIAKYSCMGLTLESSCDLTSLVRHHQIELPYYNMLGSSDPQKMYVTAGNYMRNGEKSKGFEIYNKIIEKHKNSPFAVKASDELSSWRRAAESEDNMARIERERASNMQQHEARSGTGGGGSRVFSCSVQCQGPLFETGIKFSATSVGANDSGAEENLQDAAKKRCRESKAGHWPIKIRCS